MAEEPNLYDVIEHEEKEVVDLSVVREKVKSLRDEYVRRNELEAKLKELNHKITTIERDELPEMFTRAKISFLGVEADGIHPAFMAERKTVYTAKIPDDKRLEAFKWFEDQGFGDLVKSVINITYGMQEHEKRLATMKLLADAGVEFYNNESVHAQTLRAFVKRELQAEHIIPMDLLGVYIFDEVKIK